MTWQPIDTYGGEPNHLVLLWDGTGYDLGWWDADDNAWHSYRRARNLTPTYWMELTPPEVSP